MKVQYISATGVAVVDGRLPDEGDWLRIEREALVLNILSMPESSKDLSALEPVASRIKRLSVNSATCTDLRLVERMPNLEWLSVGGLVDYAPSLKGLKRLSYFSGDADTFSEVLNLGTITALKIRWPRKQSPAVTAPLKEITLMEARNLSDLSPFGRCKDLRKMHIHGAKKLSLADIGSFPSLEAIYLQDIGAIESADELARATHLKSITFENCATLQPLEPLSAIEAAVRVVGWNPFGALFRENVGANWSFPPGAKFLPR